MGGFDLSGNSAALFDITKTAVGFSIWVLVPFSIGYVLPLVTLGRMGLNVMWVLATLALLLTIVAFSGSPGPYGAGILALPWIAALSYGLVLGCSIRELSLRRNLSERVSSALVIGGFATMPLIAGIIVSHGAWIGREPKAACLATFQMVDVAGTRYLLPNVPFIVMANENNTRTGWVINRRLRDRCTLAEKSVMPSSKFALNLAYYNRWDRFEVTTKVCSNLAEKPRWLLDVCALKTQRSVHDSREAFAVTNLPLELEVIRAPTRPYTLAQEAGKRLVDRPHRRLSTTASFSVYADSEKPYYGETYFWIGTDSADPSAFACRNIGNDVERLLRCEARYVRGANLISYAFEAEPGNEEKTFARVKTRVQGILTELTSP